MTALITLLTALALSLLVTKIATMALVHTGLSREAARFQARSAFTGSGFTTQESESVVHHPVRRRIILVLMLLGNAGIITVISTLVLTFVDPAQSWGSKLVFLVAGVGLLLFLGTSPVVDRALARLINKALKRWTRLEVRDYASLFHLAGEYRLVELQVDADDWLANRRLTELALNEEGILVLGIERRDGGYLGGPRGDSEIQPGDTLILYGRASAIEELDERRRGHQGDLAHRRAVAEQERVEREEAERAQSERTAGDK